MADQPTPTTNVNVPPKPKRPMWQTGVIGLIVACVVLSVIGALFAPKTNNTTSGTAAGGNTAASAPTAASNNQAAITQPTDTAAPPAAAPTDTTAPAAPTAAPAKQPGVGDTAETGGLQITLNGVRHSQEGLVKPKAGMEYLVVDITAANTTADKKNISSILNESVKDGTGQKYTVTIGSDAKASAEGEIAPGDKVRGETTFEVPTSATGLVFVFDPIIGGDAVRFQLDR